MGFFSDLFNTIFNNLNAKTSKDFGYNIGNITRSTLSQAKTGANQLDFFVRSKTGISPKIAITKRVPDYGVRLGGSIFNATRQTARGFVTANPEIKPLSTFIAAQGRRIIKLGNQIISY